MRTRTWLVCLAAATLGGCVYAPPPPVYTYNPYNPGDRALAGAAIGAGAGAAIGGISDGGRGAALGAVAGGALGAAAGAASTPPPPAYPYQPYPYQPYGY